MQSNAYKHPEPGAFGRIVESLANSDSIASVRRAVLSRLPFLTLESDIIDVIYVTWLVEVDAATAFVPTGLRLWQRNGLTPFTALTYRHGHFGPAIAGPLRKLFPSPLQSNWRLYLEETSGVLPLRTVLFIKNIMNNVGYALGSRIFSDVLPTHLASRFIHGRDGDSFRTSFQSGQGSAPSLSFSGAISTSDGLTTLFKSVFGSWQAAVEFLVSQDAAIAHVESIDRTVLGEIHLPVDISAIQPLHVTSEEVECSLLSALRPIEAPLCFVLPSVKFRATSERIL